MFSRRDGVARAAAACGRAPRQCRGPRLQPHGFLRACALQRRQHRAQVQLLCQVQPPRHGTPLHRHQLLHRPRRQQGLATRSVEEVCDLTFI